MEIKKMMVDASKESAGIWVDYDPETKFRIGSITSKRYKADYQTQLEAVKVKSRGRKISQEDADELQLRVFSSAIVLQWQGVTNGGKDYPCTPDNVYYVLKNCPQVRDFIVQSASDFDNFKAEVVEEAKAATGEA